MGCCPQARQNLKALELKSPWLMSEIKVEDLATDSPNFGVIRRTVLDRYDRLFAQHRPDGRLTYRRDVSQREIVAGTYTAIVLTHTQVVAGAFALSCTLRDSR